MTDTYTPEQAFARDLLITAVNGGINRCARVHGYTVDAPAEQIRAEGIDLADRCLWQVTLADLQAAIDKLITAPDHCAGPGGGIDSELLAAALGGHAAEHGPIGQSVADLVVQVAVSDEVIY